MPNTVPGIQSAINKYLHPQNILRTLPFVPQTAYVMPATALRWE